MVKKGPSMLWALLALTFFGAGGACFADTAFELEQAEQHVEEKQYEQAEAIYRAIISADPNADAAFTAQGKLAVLYVTWGKNTEAEAALDDLLTDYSDRVGIAASVDEVADEYRQTAQYQKARQTYQYVVDQWPSARLSIALCNTLELIHAGDSAGAEQALVRMISDFARHDGLAKSVYHVADKHFRLARYEKAAQVYRYVADQWPGTKFGPESRMKAALSELLVLVERGDDQALQTKATTLGTEFHGNQRFPVLIAISAEEYYRKAANLRSQGLVEQCEALLRRAINMQTIVIDEFPTSDEVPHARCWMGRYYRELGDYQSSINMFQRVVDQYPDFVFVWEAYYCVGINYESLVEKGLLDSSEAEAKIRAAYQHLLASYPDCPRAEYARDWVSQHGAQ